MKKIIFCDIPMKSNLKPMFYKEASAVKFPDDDEPLVYCKHYPECDGSLIDMMEV